MEIVEETSEIMETTRNDDISVIQDSLGTLKTKIEQFKQEASRSVVKKD